jgi:hypothetical protein
MIECFNIRSVIRDRQDQSSFHTAAEKHVRIEFRNLKGGHMVGPFTYEGDIVVTCYQGAFAIQSDMSTIQLGEFDQAVVPAGTNLTLSCETAGTVQLIWSPPHGTTTQVEGRPTETP